MPVSITASKNFFLSRKSFSLIEMYNCLNNLLNCFTATDYTNLRQYNLSKQLGSYRYFNIFYSICQKYQKKNMRIAYLQKLPNLLQ